MAEHFRPFGSAFSHMVRGNWARGPGDGEAAPVLRVTGALSVIGAICVVLQWQQPAAVLWSLACWTSGALVGFLFGIPRTSQVDDAHRTYRQRVNTNLEQISDWLTKIIVGLGLIELQRMPELIWRAGARVAASFGNAQSDVSSGIALVLYFGVVGFFLGYLLTRLYLAGAFSRADREAAGFDQK
ncbi:MAG TPA: hypothetical protein VJU61_02065, partial [Polyangiaceae bacterium]|nr:hypothetical protein [Polyangiaceae bacterium]